MGSTRAAAITAEVQLQRQKAQRATQAARAHDIIEAGEIHAAREPSITKERAGHVHLGRTLHAN